MENAMADGNFSRQKSQEYIIRSNVIFKENYFIRLGL